MAARKRKPCAHKNEPRLHHVTRAPEKCIDGGFGLILRLARRREKQCVTRGVLDRVVRAVLQDFRRCDSFGLGIDDYPWSIGARSASRVWALRKGGNAHCTHSV